MSDTMDSLMRAQYGQAQTAFARRQQGISPTQAVPPQTWLLHPPGQMAPREHFNFEPHGDGAWRIYPPGVQAPAHGPQGTLPMMPPSYDHIQSLGNDLHRQFGAVPAPPVPGPFPTTPPLPRPTPPQVNIPVGPLPGTRRQTVPNGRIPGLS